MVGDGAEQLAGFADQHPDAAVVGPRLLNPDGSLQRSARAFPTLWRLATEYLFLRKLAPRSQALNSFYEGGFDHDEVREVDWLFGACLLVRRDAADEVGLFDEDFFMFSEETDWSPAPRPCTSAAPRTAAACSPRTCVGTFASSPSTAAHARRNGPVGSCSPG